MLDSTLSLLMRPCALHNYSLTPIASTSPTAHDEQNPGSSTPTSDELGLLQKGGLKLESSAQVMSLLHAGCHQETALYRSGIRWAVREV